MEVELCALETALRGDSRIVAEIFASSISGVRVAATLLLSRLAERSMHPTQPIKVSDVDVLMANLLELIEVENEKIGQHNQIVIDAGTERGRLVDDGWAMFLSDTAVSRHIRKFSGIEASSRRTIVDRKAAIAASEKQVEIANQDISKLRDSISNTAAVAERINKLLKAMGFHRFSLGSADDPHGGYRIVREDGTPAFHSLSEGEKSFICFAYLWESLFGTLLAGGAPEDVVAVIDDPISSLDSDALFMIAAYIRDAADQVKKGTSNLRQLIVLTHNTQFHHEAAYVANSGSKERRYFRLVKDLNGVTSVRDDGTHSQIRGSYASLWHSVVDAARNEGESNLIRVGVFNIVRRILEGYFRTIGSSSEYDRPGNTLPTEKRIIAQFHIWANSGSHTITDDIDQTIDNGRTKDFLRLLKQYFDIQDHGSHFDMMVRASGGGDLLETGQIFTR